jgi:hypothetical protein
VSVGLPCPNSSGSGGPVILRIHKIVRMLPHNPLAYAIEWIILEIILLFLVSEREKAKRG